MVTKDGITIKRVDGYSNGPAVSFRSGDINVVILRGDGAKKRQYLASFFCNASDGHPRYMQAWLDKEEARTIVNTMKG